MWVSSLTTSAIFAFFFLRQPENMNAPGEIGEVFTGTVLAIILVLVLSSGVVGLLLRDK